MLRAAFRGGRREQVRGGPAVVVVAVVEGKSDRSSRLVRAPVRRRGSEGKRAGLEGWGGGPPDGLCGLMRGGVAVGL